MIFTFSGAEAGKKPTAGAHDFHVEFGGCVESIGVGLVATEAAAALVPDDFRVVGEGQPVTPLVGRTARCERVAVDDRRATAGAIVQIGAVIVSPDFTGDINNFTLLIGGDETGFPLARAVQYVRGV